MKVIFYSKRTYTYAMGFETELELITDHLEKGDDVYILTCFGELSSCTINPYHKKNICFLCQSRFREGMRKINFPKDHIFPMINEWSNYKGLQTKFNSLDELKKFSHKGVNLGLAVASSMITETSDYRLNTIKYAKMIEAKLKMSYAVYSNFLKHIKNIKPEKVYLINGRYAEDKPVLQICQKMKINCYAIEKAPSLGKYILYKNCLPHDRDYVTREIKSLWKNGPKNKEEIAAHWFYARNNRDCYPKYVNYQTRGLLPKNFDKSKQNIALFTTSIEEYEGVEGWENPIYHDEIDAIKKITKSIRRDKNTVLFIRVHPNLMRDKKCLQIEELKEIESLGFDNIFFIWPEDKIDTYGLIDSCKKIIVFGGTVGVEACFLERPVILASHAMYEKLNICYLPKTHEEVIKLIKSKLQPKNKLGALMYAYREATDGITFKKFKQIDPVEKKFSGDNANKHIFKFLNNRLCIEGEFLGTAIMPKLSYAEQLYLFILFIFSKNTWAAIFKKLR